MQTLNTNMIHTLIYLRLEQHEYYCYCIYEHETRTKRHHETHLGGEERADLLPLPALDEAGHGRQPLLGVLEDVDLNLGHECLVGGLVEGVLSLRVGRVGRVRVRPGEVVRHSSTKFLVRADHAEPVLLCSRPGLGQRRRCCGGGRCYGSGHKLGEVSAAAAAVAGVLLPQKQRVMIMCINMS